MTKKSLFVMIVVAVCGFAAGDAVATGSSPSALAAGVNVKPRNKTLSGLSLPEKGVKVFGADGTATLVTDEKGVVATTGLLVSLEIAHLTPGSVPACYLMAFDSSVAADTTETGSVSRMLVPPLAAVTSPIGFTNEFVYPKQFHKGLVVLVKGTGAANCRASASWSKNGGDN